MNINSLPTFTFLKLSDKSFLHARESCYNTDWFTMVLNTMQNNLCLRHYFENSSLNPLCISQQNNFLKTQFKFHLLHTALSQVQPTCSIQLLMTHSTYCDRISHRLFYNKLALREPLCCTWYSTFIFFAVSPAQMNKPRSCQIKTGIQPWK